MKHSTVVPAGKERKALFRLEPNNRDWTIEGYVNSLPEPIKIEDTKWNQNVHIRDNKNITVHVSKKVNNITLENCHHVTVVADSVISSVEMIRSRKCQLQILGNASAVTLDNCQEIEIYASFQSRGLQITSSQIADVNFHCPESEDQPDEWVELPVPAQFVHSLAPSSNTLLTKVSDLYR